MQPYRCPVCDGRGLVPAGFYHFPRTLTSTAAGVTSERCRSCVGAGVLWSPASQQAPSPLTTFIGVPSMMPLPESLAAICTRCGLSLGTCRCYQTITVTAETATIDGQRVELGREGAAR